jgi:hypothetical protein
MVAVGGFEPPARKALLTIFLQGSESQPAPSFEFLHAEGRRFRVPWLPPPLAETSESFLYLRTKAGRAARM